MALIPPFFLDCVVAVGFPDEDGGKKWSASGFLYGKLVEEGSAKEKTYEIFLVTNRHVFEVWRVHMFALIPRRMPPLVIMS